MNQGVNHGGGSGDPKTIFSVSNSLILVLQEEMLCLTPFPLYSSTKLPAFVLPQPETSWLEIKGGENVVERALKIN